VTSSWSFILQRFKYLE